MFRIIGEYFCVGVHFRFFFNDTATTEIYTYGHTLSLHDALPISATSPTGPVGCSTTSGTRWVACSTTSPTRSEPTGAERTGEEIEDEADRIEEDRKSTRLNSSH